MTDPPMAHRAPEAEGREGQVPHTARSLTVTLSFAYLTVRHVRNGRLSALLFEEFLSELPVDWLVAHGLTPREPEVLRWLPTANLPLR